MALRHLTEEEVDSLAAAAAEFVEKARAILALEPGAADSTASSAILGVLSAMSRAGAPLVTVLPAMGQTVGHLIGSAPGDELDRIAAINLFLSSSHHSYQLAARIHDTVGSA